MCESRSRKGRVKLCAYAAHFPGQPCRGSGRSWRSCGLFCFRQFAAMVHSMPAKKTASAKSKRAGRRQASARGVAAEDAPRAFNQAFSRVVRPKPAGSPAPVSKSPKTKPRGR